jgi:predicted Zn finger-like uncharacterized protein
MQTHCPQCKTTFRVTEAQINTADGLVRCGVCEKVFNVFEVTDITSIEHGHQQSSAQDEYADAASPEKITAAETEQPARLSTQNIDEAVSFDGKSPPSPDKLQEESLDFFNEEITVSLPHVVPEKFRRQPDSATYSATSTVLWGTGALILAACLLLEYVWFNRDHYSKSPELQTVIEMLCQQFECKNLAMREPEKIELVARNIYTHPNEKNALMVDVTMKNQAKFSQPYPLMNISFSDIRGNAVAFRSFLPDEYLPVAYKRGNKKQQAILHPDESTSLTLEIMDPGKQATTYEFNFL